MKKIIALLLVAVMCFSLAACGGDKETSNNNEPQTNNNGTQQEVENTQEENTVNLAGVWTDGGITATTITINEDGTGHFKDETRDFDIEWETDGSVFQFEGWKPLDIVVTEDGKTTLVMKDGMNNVDWVFSLQEDAA